MPEIETKVCTICDEAKRTTEFNKRGDGLRSYCRACKRKRNLEWYENRHRQIQEDGKGQCTRCKEVKAAEELIKGMTWCRRCYWDHQLMRKYGVTADWYEAQLESQGGRCGICRSDEPGVSRGFNVDHRAECGTVRGLLCNWCNRNLVGCLEQMDRATALRISPLVAAWIDGGWEAVDDG